MTDPFKKQRYSSPSMSKSSPSHVANTLSTIEENTFNKYTSSAFSMLPNEDSDNATRSSFYERNLSHEKKPHQQQQQMPLNQQENEQAAFVRAHLESNKELIAQLKSNIELLFKASKIFGQFGLFPFKVLRWQSQIHSESVKYHLTPFTLIPVFYNLGFQHGFLTQWKGCFSMAAYIGTKVISESVIGEIVSCEKDFNEVKSPNTLYGHVALKFGVCCLTTPLFLTVIYESVQSGISNESIGLIDLLKETRNRITGYRYNYRTRLIPFWSLILPTSFYFMGVHFVSAGLEKCMNGILSGIRSLFFNEKRRIYGIDEIEQEIVEQPYINALTQLTSQLGALALLYPVETVVNRLIVQGTRTIIDNTDNGLGVVPINTRYDGFFDCFNSINETEGIFGFYKGIGSLMIETAFHFALLKFAKVIAYHIYDSEWTTKADNNKIQNLMTSGNYVATGSSTPSSISPTFSSQRLASYQQESELYPNKTN